MDFVFFEVMLIEFTVRRALGFILLLASLILSACRTDVPTLTEETDPSYKDAVKELDIGGRDKKTRALQLFLKVIEKHRAAPISHMQVGLLYLDPELGDPDPISAIYHFKKCLEFNSDQQNPELKAKIETQIVRAEKIFMRSLPGDPYNDRVINNDQVEELLISLRKENEVLRAKIQSITNASQELSLQEPRQDTPTRSGSRVYKVTQGDTLFKIASKVYGDSARWREIFDANRNVMRRENDLQPGQELVIP